MDTHVAVGETERRPGTFVPYKKLPNTITTCPPGIRPGYRSANEHKIVVCAISKQFLDRVETELDKRPSGPIHQLYGTEDYILRDLLLLLAKEAKAGGPSGKLYAESLSTALATRLLFAAGRYRNRNRVPQLCRRCLAGYFATYSIVWKPTWTRT
jgi:hypothetical protein